MRLERREQWEEEDEPRSGAAIDAPRADTERWEDDDEPERPVSKRAGTPFDPARLGRVLRRGKWFLLGAAMLGLAIGGAVAKLAMGHSYEATASVRYEGAPPLETGDGEGGYRDPRSDLPSRLETLRREDVLRDIRTRVGMTGVSLRAIQALFTATPDAESGLLTISAQASSSEGAAALANTVIDTLVAHERDNRLAEIDAASHTIGERMRVARAELEAARARYDAFRNEHGISDLDTEQGSALAHAATLRAQAGLAQAEIASLEARVAQLRSEVAHTPRMEVVSSQSESIDQSELARAEAHLDQLRGSLSPDHPRLQVAERQVRSLRSRVGSGGGARTVGSVSVGASSTYATAQTALATAQADLEAARQRSVSLASLATQADERTGGLSAMEGEAASLLAEVEVKEALVNQLETNRARLVTMRENPDPGFRIVARAIPPESAVPSQRKLAVALAFPAGLVLLVLAVMITVELRGFRMHTASEIAFWGQAPVIGTTTWPRDAAAAGELVADLDDCAPDARGTMLVVGATEHETPLAAEIASLFSSDWHDATILEAEEEPQQLGATSAPGTAITVGARAVSQSRDVLRPARIDDRLIATAWDGPPSGQALRRAARLATRVLVVVPSGAIGARDLGAITTRLGRRDRVAFVLTGMDEQYALLPDRAGATSAFWSDP